MCAMGCSHLYYGWLLSEAERFSVRLLYRIIHFKESNMYAVALNCCGFFSPPPVKQLLTKVSGTDSQLKQ